jgi:hypothetical protein
VSGRLIYCGRKWLADRCSRAGLLWAECERCIVASDGNALTVDSWHQDYPRPGLGDMVKSSLAAVGITDERVSRAIGRPCGCRRRAEKLNEIGRALGIGSG